ncbi:hypothetical protein MKW94_017022, partial [Papaver nudicaule]|nr:hypothetical protein [Papaver nudicaule]
VVEKTSAATATQRISTSLEGREVCNPEDFYTDITWAPTTDCARYCTASWCSDECAKKWGSTMLKTQCTVVNNSVHCDCCCKNNLSPPPPPPSPPPPPPPSPPPPPPPCPSPPQSSCCGSCNTDINVQISVTQGCNAKVSPPSSSCAAGDSL